ncbi:MAG: hypothetical protein DI556_22080 [Rhodovulum sulfidophilum]|uniref:Enoyl-CoA hydratase n=1 Tax=Rhodovulum sulfidophilum TaxID=35806 RepID=A0A2W5N4Y8_RHOSU|nr:MAG: hypothetical protein DI556_22080 [Rhodovulum sulfidophilum]
MPDPDPVLLDIDAASGVATLTFNRPEVLNALDLGMAESFGAAVARLSRREDIRCVVLTGAGRAFMAGGDVAAFAADPEAAGAIAAEILARMNPAILALRAMDAPILAAVNGAAAGAGFSLVLAADHVVAAASARLVLAYDRIGAAPDCGGSWFLPRKLGRSRAFGLMLNGGVLGADEAAGLGLVDRVAPDDAFTAEVAAAATRIAAGPTRAFGLFKRLLDAELPLAEHLEREKASFVTATETADFRAATRAFTRKEPPVFRGR